MVWLIKLDLNTHLNFKLIYQGNILNQPDVRRLYQIIDVREVNELQVSSIQGADIINLPLSRANEYTQDILDGKILDKSKPTICLCKVGMRSMRMAMYLTQQAGFNEVYNVDGGITEYAQEVDNSIALY